MSYVIHCTVKKFDKGLNAPTKARPTFYIDAKTREEAIYKAKDKAYSQYSEPLADITGIEINLVRKVGG